MVVEEIKDKEHPVKGSRMLPTGEGHGVRVLSRSRKVSLFAANDSPRRSVMALKSSQSPIVQPFILTAHSFGC